MAATAPGGHYAECTFKVNFSELKATFIFNTMLRILMPKAVLKAAVTWVAAVALKGVDPKIRR